VVLSLGAEMRRRDFIKVFAGSGFTWPLVARAQQAERMPTIGVLMNRAQDDPEGQARLTVFRQALEQLGWSEGGLCRSLDPGLFLRFGTGSAFVRRPG
jgi:putative tryptophan/tyrosine transport system substrate-binding protein